MGLVTKYEDYNSESRYHFCSCFFLLSGDGQMGCQTYESFAEALVVILWEFRQEMMAWEKEVIQQGIER